MIAKAKNIIANRIITNIFNNKGKIVSKLNTSILVIKSLLVIYQYVGHILDICTTNSGINSSGTKHPHIKLDPSATTLVIPFIESLFFRIVPVKKPSPKAA